MEIKDLAGLSQPLTKLIEVISSGIGNLSESYLIRKKTEAKVFEIDAVANAIRRNVASIASLEYENQSVTVVGKEEEKEQTSIERKIEDRLLSRLLFQEGKRQQNIEQVAQYAAEQLKDEKEVSSEKLDEDWISRFFNIAEDVTNEELQMLWGKVLAGEVKRPKSYSVRTLEFLKNLSKEEAQIFSKVGQASIIAEGKAFIKDFGGDYLETKFGITFLDLLTLKELGVLIQTDLVLTLKPVDAISKYSFLYGKKCVILTRDANTSSQPVNLITYSTIGKELLSLIDIKADQEYLEKFAKLWIRDGVKAGVGDVLEVAPHHIEFSNLREITDN